MALGFNPQKSSVEYQDNTGSHAPNPHKKLGHKTMTLPSQGIAKFGLRLIAFLNQYLKTKNNEDPKYLQGKNK